MTTILCAITLSCLISNTYQNRRCVVDQCKTCRYVNIDTCEACESGYYLRTFQGDDKGRPYNACWSIWKLILGTLLSLCLLCSYCYCCYEAWRRGKNVTRIVNKKLPKQIIKDQTKGPGTNTANIQPNNTPAPGVNVNGAPGQPGQANLNVGTPGAPAPIQSGYQGAVTPPPSTSRPLYSPTGMKPTGSKPMRRRTSSGEITIIRERPKTIIRELSPERPTPAYQRPPQQPVYVQQPRQSNVVMVPVQQAPNIYATPQRPESAYYSNPPRRLF